MPFGERLGHDGVDELRNISSKARNFPDQAGGDEGVLLIRSEENGFQSGIHPPIHGRQLEFELEV